MLEEEGAQDSGTCPGDPRQKGTPSGESEDHGPPQLDQQQPHHHQPQQVQDASEEGGGGPGRGGEVRDDAEMVWELTIDPTQYVVVKAEHSGHYYQCWIVQSKIQYFPPNSKHPTEDSY